jgi:hypothetical protein
MLGPCPQVDVHDGRELHETASRRSAKSEKTIVRRSTDRFEACQQKMMLLIWLCTSLVIIHKR